MTNIIYKLILCLVCIMVCTSNVNAQTDNSIKTVQQTNTNLSDKNNQTVKSILAEMDKRMNKDSLLKVRMQLWENDTMSEYFYTMKCKDNNQYLLLRYYSPDRWKDTSILMVEKDIWIYDDSSDRLLQVPSNLAFGGTDIAHGDIMRLNISGNYDGNIIKEDEDTWTLDLITKNRTMPYNKLEIIINKQEYYPVSVKCFSNSNRIIKTIVYSDIEEVNGTMKPTKYTFSSPYEPNKYHVIKIIDEKLNNYPEHFFDKWILKSKVDEQF